MGGNRQDHCAAMKRLAGTAVAFMIGCAPAFADSDTLLPLTMKSFAAEFKKALLQAGVHKGLAGKGCLEGGQTKRTVCSYRIGEHMAVMTSTEVGKTDLVGVTLICTGGDLADTTECLLIDAAAVSLTAPAMTFATRGKLMSALIRGMEVGDSISIVTGERRYILQKGVGVWFHVYAADSKDAQ